MKLLLAPFYCAYDEVVKSLCATDDSGFQIAGTSLQECMQGLCLCQASIRSEINKGLFFAPPFTLIVVVLKPHQYY